MSIKVSTGSPARAWDSLFSVAQSVKKAAENDAAAYAKGSTVAAVQQHLENWRTYRSRINTLRMADGLPAYAEIMQDDTSFKVRPEFLAVADQITATITALRAALPKDADGKTKGGIENDDDRTDEPIAATALAAVIVELNKFPALLT